MPGYAPPPAPRGKPAGAKAKGLYAPRPLSAATELGRLLVALELPDCDCPLPELPADPAYEIEVPAYRILVLAFQKRCEHVLRRAEAVGHWPAAKADRVLTKLLRSLRAYDPDGYEPRLAWRRPVWLAARGGKAIDVGGGVRMASRVGWAAVYRARAAAGLPLYHPDDQNPRDRGEARASLQGAPGNRQGGVIDERQRRVKRRVRKGEEPGWLDRVILQYQGKGGAE